MRESAETSRNTTIERVSHATAGGRGLSEASPLDGMPSPPVKSDFYRRVPVFNGGHPGCHAGQGDPGRAGR